MKKHRIFIVIACLCLAVPSQARDDREKHSIADAMNTTDAKEILNRGFQFKFGSQRHGSIAANYGEFMSNKKTSAFGKSSEQACQRAFLSAMVTLQERISKEGGNAAVNIRSYYKRSEFSSESEFECGAGAMVAGVTLKAKVVKLN